MTSFATSTDGTRIAYETVGHGPSLVLVGGAFLDRKSSAAGTPLAALLADRFRVTSYDRRARGESEAGTSPYAIEREVEDLDAVVRAVKAGALFGMSSGALLALDYAATHPIEQLVAYEPPLVLDDARLHAMRALIDEVERALAAGDRSDAAALFLTKGVMMPAAAVDGMKRTPFWAEREALAHTLAFDLRITAVGKKRLDEMKRVTARVVVVDGGASPPWMRAANDALAHACVNARRTTLVGQTHAVETRTLADAIVDGLRA